jgi:tetratricopeptide (TPR) repeat protein
MKATEPYCQPSADQRLSSHAFSQVLRRAETALKTGGANESKKIAQGLLSQDPTHVGALEVLAKAQWTLSQHTELLDTLGVLVRINPYEPGYYILRGNCLRNMGRYGEALRSFVRAGDADGAREAVEELSALQSDLVVHLLEEDAVFRAQYAHDPELACASRGFEFGSETKIRHWVLANEYSSARVMQRPS